MRPLTSFAAECTGLAFQSLLYWISHCGSLCRHRRRSFSRRFQSLLYWISHCGSRATGSDFSAFSGFNPCCIGLAIAANRLETKSLAAVEFQSLLYWISHCGQVQDGGGQVGGGGFNPCCIGLAIAAWAVPNHHRADTVVSILVVLD